MGNKIDACLEEDEEVFVHPRDPYHRVDILESSRHVKVSLNGEVVAETERPRILFETGLPPRYYIPLEDVREDVLVPSEKTTRCPYKGVASYWSVEAGGERVEDLVWYYPEPLPEAQRRSPAACASLTKGWISRWTAKRSRDHRCAGRKGRRSQLTSTCQEATILLYGGRRCTRAYQVTYLPQRNR
jgi:uncharacterized protein (DUF427 family)